MPDGSITTGTGTYAMAYTFFDVGANPMSPDRWNIVASDLIFQGQINISNINAQARWNTWDDNVGDATDKLGAWYMWGPYAGSGKGIWMTGVQWTGGSDYATDIRQIFHMQDSQGTQPPPRWWTGPYTGTSGPNPDPGYEWLDDWFNFKLEVHATSSTTGTGKMWINDQLIGPDTESGAPETFSFDKYEYDNVDDKREQSKQSSIHISMARCSDYRYACSNSWCDIAWRTWREPCRLAEKTKDAVNSLCVMRRA